MGKHQCARAQTHIWLTPRHVIEAFPEFDLDPCAAPLPRPWPTAKRMITLPEDGLSAPWHGRVWLNPPYGHMATNWLQRMVEHNNGIALIFARTETHTWHDYVWPHASAVLFPRGRLTFCDTNGHSGVHNGGAPSAFIAFGSACAGVLCRAAPHLGGGALLGEPAYCMRADEASSGSTGSTASLFVDGESSPKSA